MASRRRDVRILRSPELNSARVKAAPHRHEPSSSCLDIYNVVTTSRQLFINPSMAATEWRRLLVRECNPGPFSNPGISGLSLLNLGSQD